MKKISEKLSPVITFFKKRPLLLSLILCLTAFGFYFCASGFNIVSGNDDYVVFKLIYNGEFAIGCMGYFFTGFIYLIQPLFGNLNSYMIVQELICFGSLLAINYVILAKLRNRMGFFLTVLFDIVYFSFITLEILFTYTAVVGCSAGLVLILYAAQFESRKGFKITQGVLGFVLLFTGSQVRYSPFQSLAAIFAVFAFSIVLVSFIKNKKGNSVKTAFLSTVKKYLKTGVLVLISFIIVYSANSASAALKHTVDGYDELVEYNNAISSVNDHNICSFFYEKDFYRSIGVESNSDLVLLRNWFIDEDFFTAEKLRAIRTYSDENLSYEYGKKDYFGYITTPIFQSFSEWTSDGSIVIIAIAALVALTALVIAIVIAPKKRAAILRLSSFILLWSFFLLVSGGFSYKNLMVLPFMILTFYISFKYDIFQYIITMALSLIMIILFFYLLSYRYLFHPLLAVFFPISIFAILSLDKSRVAKISSAGKNRKPATAIISVIAIICALISAHTLFFKWVYVEFHEDNKKLTEYIDNNPDKVFLINQIVMLRGYYNPLIMSEEQENVVNYGLWVGKSHYMQNMRKINGIEHVFKDAIDNDNVLIPMYDATFDGGHANTFAMDFEAYYTEHYAEEGKEIKLESEGEIEGYSLYKVVSEKAKDGKNTKIGFYG